MIERQKIEERLRKKQAEVVTLEEKVKVAKVYINALQDILRMLGQDTDPSAEADTKLKPGGSVAQARDIILARGEPVYIDDLLGAMGKDASTANKASLAGSIAAYVRRREIFTRTGPNTFGLLELGHTDADEEDVLEEPPAGFGREPVGAVEIDDDVPF